MQKDNKALFFEEDTSDKAAEFLRMTITMLGQKKMPATMVNYCLCYGYVSGKDQRLKDKLDLLFEDSSLSHDDAKNLFLQTYYDDDVVMAELRRELTEIAAEVLGSLVDIASKTSKSNKNLEGYIEILENSANPKDILKAVSSIVSSTRDFIVEAQQLENDVKTSFEDIRKLQDELINARMEATTDALTGLKNRRSFNSRLSELLIDAQNSGKSFSLIMIDVDNFKNINDVHGHLTGDKVLVKLAELFSNKVRGEDLPARFGGEEFAILLSGTPEKNARVVAENIRRNLENLKLSHTQTGKHLGKITASFGVTGYRNGDTGENIVGRCDKALYIAKEKGRNCTVLAN